MKCALLAIALLLMGSAPAAWADQLYSNTMVDTDEAVLYSFGPYTALGDEIQLAQSGTAGLAQVELYNNGGAGTFNAQLNFFNVGSSPSSPVGSLMGSFDQTDISSVGGDEINITFGLGPGLAIPLDLIFTVTVSNESADDMDLGVELYDGPTVGYSDPTFLIVENGSGVFSEAVSDANVYFELDSASGAVAPEASSLTLMVAGLLLMGLRGMRRERAARVFP